MSKKKIKKFEMSKKIEKFSGSLENISELVEAAPKLKGLLCADDKNRKNYYLPEDLNQQLFENDVLYDKSMKLYLYKTDYRLEKLDIEQIEQIELEKILVLFTHEWYLNDEENRLNFDKMVNVLYKNIYKFIT